MDLVWESFQVTNCFILFLASAIQQEETCIESDSRERVPSSKLQSAIYYALDGDQVNILMLLSQRGEDPWVSQFYSTFLGNQFNTFLFSWNISCLILCHISILLDSTEKISTVLENIVGTWLKV